MTGDETLPTGSLNVLVTGAGSGLGRGVALALSARGHQVTAGVLTDEERWSLAVEDDRIEAIRLDITDAEDREQVRDLEIDVLFNNAGLAQAGPLRSIPMELIRRVFEVNVFGTLAMTQTVVPGMIERGRGRILIMSSIAGVLAGPFTGPYSMTKHALQAMGSAFRHELAPAGIDVALVNPGPFDTGFNQKMIEDSLSWYEPQKASAHEQRLLAETRERITGAQLDPQAAIDSIVDLVEAGTTELVNFIPADLLERLGH